MNRWSAAKLAGFRFIFVYLVLYNLPFPAGASGVIPGLEWLSEAYSKLWAIVIAWLATHVLSLQPILYAATGSGDRTFDYIQVGCLVALSAAAALAWSIVDERRRRYRTLFDGLRVYVRYTLACAMLAYGFAKIFKLQFPFPTPLQLLQPYGESSPMGLLWKFMGYSTAYNVFVGALEAAGGILLFFRRTTTMGALLVIGSMANVVMLNFCYDVPVKLYSIHILAMAVFLVAPDLNRLTRVFVLNQPAMPADIETAFPLPWMNKYAPTLRMLFIITVLCLNFKGSLDWFRARGDNAPRHPLYGAYEVEGGNPRGWHRVGVDNNGRLSVKLADDTFARFLMKEDREKKSIILISSDDRTPKGELSYTQPNPDHLTLAGQWMSGPLDIRLRKIPESKWQLLNRGFHWVNEFPYNK